MKTYIAVIHKDADSAYGAHFPDLAGCFSAADTLEELRANISEALALYLEDEPDLPARDLDALREDKEVASALADGAFLLCVPAIKLTGRNKRINITIDAGLLNAIDATTKERGVSRSAFLADLARVEITG